MWFCPNAVGKKQIVFRLNANGLLKIAEQLQMFVESAV